MIRFFTYNLFCYGPTATAEERQRRERVHRVLAGVRAAADRAGDGLVVAVQEVIASDPVAPGDLPKSVLAGQRLMELADATKLDCEYMAGKPAIAIGGQRHHLGLLWNDRVEPVGALLRTIGGPRLWHALQMMPFEVGTSTPVLHANYHAPSVDLNRKAGEAEQVRSALLDPRIGLPVLAAGDWNFTGADLVLRRSYDPEENDRWVLYDHDPHLVTGRNRQSRVEWHPEFVHQCIITVDNLGRLHWEVDRRPGQVLYYGGLRDAAAALDAPWKPTVGHWPGDAMGARRVDAVRVSGDVVDALVSHDVLDQPLEDGLDPATASDHLGALVIYDPTRISREFGLADRWRRVLAA